LAVVKGNLRICEGHYLLRLLVRGFPATAAGQFVQLQCRSLEPPVSPRQVEWPADGLPKLRDPDTTGREAFLRRPLSLAGRKDTVEGTELEVIYRVVGAGTRWLATVTAGEELSVLGPLGNSFRIDPEKPRAALIGGGVGIPPMVYLAEQLAEAGKEVVAFNGVRSADMLPLTLISRVDEDSSGHPTFCTVEFARNKVPAVISTDDGTLGVRGTIGEVFRRWLDENDFSADELVVYCCGPEPMMKAVGELCVSRGIECQLAMERHMACGMGTCQSCVVKIRDGSERGWSFKLCCADGPVFDAGEVLWQ